MWICGATWRNKAENGWNWLRLGWSLRCAGHVGSGAAWATQWNDSIHQYQCLHQVGADASECIVSRCGLAKYMQLCEQEQAGGLAANQHEQRAQGRHTGHFEWKGVIDMTGVRRFYCMNLLNQTCWFRICNKIGWDSSRSRDISKRKNAKKKKKTKEAFWLVDLRMTAAQWMWASLSWFCHMIRLIWWCWTRICAWFCWDLLRFWAIAKRRFLTKG